jgi:protein O-mannosyl-transferase
MPTANTIKKRRKPTRPAPKPVVIKPLAATDAELSSGKSAEFMRLRAAPAILLAIVTFAVYFQVLRNPFANYDDADYVLQNANVQHGLNGATLRWALTSTDHANWHPVTWLSHAADWELFGPNPAGHHLTSLLLHIANVVLLFFFLERVTQARLRSLAVAALFAVHPLNVESVVWIAERKNVLCMLFFLLTLLAYSSYARRPGVWRYLPVALGLALGLAAKPMLVTVPFVLLLLDFWPLQRVQGWSQPSRAFPVPQAPWWRLAAEKLPLLALSAADSVITMIAQNKASALRPVARYPLSDRLGNAILSYVDYLWKLLWPSHLAVFYPHPAGNLRLWQVALCAFLLLAASDWIWRQRSRRYLLTGWCWFLGTLVPVIGLIQVGDQAMANRYMYLPAIGIFILAVWGLAEVAEHIPSRLRSYAGVGVAIAYVLFSVVSVGQVRVWRTNDDLWTQVLAVDKNNAAAEDVVGSEILVRALNAGQTYSAEAQVHFQNALRIDPKDSEALLNIGADLQARGNLREAIEKYQSALQNAADPILKFRILTDMGSAYEKLADLETARRYYREALTLGVKDDPTAFVGFARTYTDEQIASLTKTLISHPTAEGYWKLGQLQEAGGYLDEANASYQHALQLNPKFDAARQALDKMGRVKS